MVLNINPKPTSLSIQKNLLKSQTLVNKALERLSSGKRINRAGDDAAGLAIANLLGSQLRGLEQAARNTNDGISMIQTAEGAIGQSNEILQRMRELSVQAANDINSPAARSAIQAEMDQLNDELGRISQTASFNGLNLLDGSLQGKSIQVGAEAGQTIELNVGELSPNSMGTTGIDVTTQAGASAALTALDGAIAQVNEARSGLGALQNRLEATVENLGAATENLAASRSRIMDADFAREVAERIRGQILARAGVAALGQANISAQAALSLLGD